MKYQYPFTAIAKNGSTILLYNMQDVYNFVTKYGWWGEYWFKSCCFLYDRPRTYHPSFPWNKDVVYYDWIMRDDFGRAVDPFDFDLREFRRRRKTQGDRQRHAAALGLPIPGVTHSRAGWKANQPAAKNSGKGKRNRDRALCEYERIEYGIKNKYGKSRRWEGYY